MKYRQMDKAVYASKINWVGFAIMMIGVITDPEIYKNLASVGLVIPEWLVARLIQWGGFLIMIIRTFATEAAQMQPGPDSPPDLWLDENGKPLQTVKGVREE